MQRIQDSLDGLAQRQEHDRLVASVERQFRRRINVLRQVIESRLRGLQLLQKHLTGFQMDHEARAFMTDVPRRVLNGYQALGAELNDRKSRRIHLLRTDSTSAGMDEISSRLIDAPESIG